MDLRQFIKEALLDIVGGVDDANDASKSGGNRFMILGWESKKESIDGDYVNFDVSLVVNSGSNKGVNGNGRIGFLSVVSAGIGVEMNSNTSNVNQLTQHLSFKVYISKV